MRSIISMYMINIPDDQNWPNKPNVPNDPLKFVPDTNKGWECPRCHRCYAPWVPDCETCGKVAGTGSAIKSTGPGPMAEFVGVLCDTCNKRGLCKAALNSKGQCSYWEKR